jgi:thiosulfate dehydrogenase [quinone] large subunit
LNTQTSRGALTAEVSLSGTQPGEQRNLRGADWLFRSKVASVSWLVARLWLGYGWLNAGYQKLWGSEKAFFWNGGGAGVKGFASAGVTGSKAGTGGASYGWFAGILHGFVIPNASWIAKVVSVSELVIGALLILGLFTGLAAVAGLALNVVYMFSGSSGVNPAYAIVAVLLILAWRNAGYLGLDRYVLPMMRNQFRHGPGTVTPVAPPPTLPTPVPAPAS